ncbi:7TM diverse intracellular signaling domain-containing protein [Ekhidna sp.]|uniref:7TM diverse intracellular signaling domain-containing protein n=1 Tax=Ekhidna sp. TaxID=2608089 RepID=UPI003CCC06EB
MHLSIKTAFFFIAFSILSIGDLSSQEAIDLETFDGEMINAKIRVYHSSETLSGIEALEQIRKGAMPETNLKINAGMTFPEDSYWLTFQIVNSDKESKDAFIVLDYPQLDYLDLFEVREDTIHNLYQTGDQYAFDQRPVSARNFVLPVSISNSDTAEYLMHLQKYNSTMRFPIYVYEAANYQKQYFNSNLKYSLYFGFILLISISAMALGFIVNKSVFKIYSLYVLSFALWLFTRLGYSYQFLVSEFPEFNRHLLAAAGQLAIMMLIFYVRSFFKTKESLPRFHKVMDVVLIIFVIGAITWITWPDKYVEYATNLFLLRYSLFLIAVVFAFTAAIHHRKVNRFKSRMFLLAYSLFLSAIVGKILMDYGLFREDKLLFDPIQLGFLIEVIVLSIAMGVILKQTLSKSKEVVQEHEQLKRQMEVKEEVIRNGYLKLNSKAVVSIDNISYIKSDDHYLEFYFKEGQKEIDRNSLSQLVDSLPPNFIQTHRSYVINLNHARILFADRVVMNGGEEVRLSRSYKKKFQDQLNGIKSN